METAATTVHLPLTFPRDGRDSCISGSHRTKFIATDVSRGMEVKDELQQRERSVGKVDLQSDCLLIGCPKSSQAFKRQLHEQDGLSHLISTDSMPASACACECCLMNEHACQSLRERNIPNIIVMIRGGNDLGKIQGVELVARMQQNLQHLHQRFPGM